jgi:hypothetical protein
MSDSNSSDEEEYLRHDYNNDVVYIIQNNVFNEFLDELFILTDNINDKIGVKKLYYKYMDYYYSKTRRIEDINPSKFCNITKNCLNKKKIKNGTFYTHIKFKNL